MAEKNRASIMFIVEEAVQGTLEMPTLPTQAIALQEGFSFAPNFDTLENAEIRASIGTTKLIQGLEQPASSFDHYLRHSGREGEKPNYSPILFSLMGEQNLFYTPMVVSNANNKLDFIDDDGAATATVANGTYTTPQALAAAVQTALRAAQTDEEASVVYSVLTGKFTISSTGTVFELPFDAGASTATSIGALLGYDLGTDYDSATSYEADDAVNAIERVLDAGSTVSNLVTTAAATEMGRGKAVLVKDGVNGFSIRPVLSRDGVNLALGFNLENAPAAGVLLGQNVNYSPADDGHPKLSLHLYRGNGGAYEAMAGAQATSMGISIEAGQLINASYAFEGVKYFYNPIEITASSRFIDFTDDDGTVAASISTGTYTDPHELAAALQAAMRSVQTDELATVVYNDFGANKGKFTISCTGVVFSILWQSGTNAANSIGTKLGFLVAANDTGALTYTSDNKVSWAATIAPTYDTADANVAKNNEVLIGDANDLVCFCASSVDITVTNSIQNVECVCAESGIQEKIINVRSIEIAVVGILERDDADKFRRFRSNADTAFLYNFGSKAGGNWVPGTCTSLYVPQSTITSHELGDNGGLATLEIAIRPYVGSIPGEFYINFL